MTKAKNDVFIELKLDLVFTIYVFTVPSLGKNPFVKPFRKPFYCLCLKSLKTLSVSLNAKNRRIIRYFKY